MDTGVRHYKSIILGAQEVELESMPNAAGSVYGSQVGHNERCCTVFTLTRDVRGDVGEVKLLFHLKSGWETEEVDVEVRERCTLGTNGWTKDEVQYVQVVTVRGRV